MFSWWSRPNKKSTLKTPIYVVQNSKYSVLKVFESAYDAVVEASMLTLTEKEDFIVKSFPVQFSEFNLQVDSNLDQRFSLADLPTDAQLRVMEHNKRLDAVVQVELDRLATIAASVKVVWVPATETYLKAVAVCVAAKRKAKYRFVHDRGFTGTAMREAYDTADLSLHGSRAVLRLTGEQMLREHDDVTLERLIDLGLLEGPLVTDP